MNKEIYRLKEIVSFKTGKLNANAAVEKGKYPFFTCSQETFRTNTYSFDCECVLLGGNNANAVYPLKYFFGKFDAYQRTYIICPLDRNQLNTKYLYYALHRQLDLFKSVSTGATTKFLTLGILNNIKMPIPPLPTQRKIAGILSAYDDLIENNTRRIEILEEMARMLYREWFVKFRFPVDDGSDRSGDESDRSDNESDRLGNSRGDRSGDGKGDRSDNESDRLGNSRGDRSGDGKGDRSGDGKGDRSDDIRGDRSGDESDRSDDIRGDRLGNGRGDRSGDGSDRSGDGSDRFSDGGDRSSNNLPELVESELGLIPKGWEVKRFTDIANILSRGTPKTERPEYWGGDIPFFTPKDAPSSFYVTSTDKKITELGLAKCNSKLYPSNTIFITARGTVGKTVLIPVPMAMNQSCFALQGKHGFNQFFVFMTINHYIEHLRKKASGATFDAIVIATFNQIFIKVPPYKLIDEFEKRVESLFAEIVILLNKNLNLRKTRDLLLPRLISGEIDVEDLDINIGEIKS